MAAILNKTKMAKYARRRKRKVTRSSRRRRVGATKGILNPNSPMLLLGTAAVTYFALADTVNGALDKVVPASMQAGANYPMMAGAVEAGGGLLLAMTGKKTMIKQVAAGVLLGAGLKRVMAGVGVGGFRDIPAVGAVRRRMAGFRNIPAVGAFNPLQNANKNLGAFNPISSQRSMAGIGAAAGSGCF